MAACGMRFFTTSARLAARAKARFRSSVTSCICGISTPTRTTATSVTWPATAAKTAPNHGGGGHRATMKPCHPKMAATRVEGRSSPGYGSTLATHSVVVPVEPVRVVTNDPELAMRDVCAVEVGRRRRDVHVGVGGMAALGCGLRSRRRLRGVPRCPVGATGVGSPGGCRCGRVVGSHPQEAVAVDSGRDPQEPWPYGRVCSCHGGETVRRH